MKRFFILFSIAALSLFSACSYDDGDIWDKVNDIDERVKSLEDKIEAMNREISAISEFVNAAKEGKYISDVRETENGYVITFSDGSTAALNHGKDGGNGADGTTPIIGVKQDTDGVYYWTVTTGEDTEWMTDPSGNKIPVTGGKGADGEKGDKGETPQIGVDSEGYWTVTVGGTTTHITDADGNKIKAAGTSGDSFFSDVEVTDTSVTLTLASGTSFTIPIVNMSLSIDAGGTEYLKYGETREFELTMTNIDNYSITKPDGWKASVSGTTLSVTAPDSANPYAEVSGVIAITATSNSYAAIQKFNVEASAFHIVTFESDNEGSLAGPTSYGENLYDGHADQVFGFYDKGSDLMLIVNEAYGTYNMWNGATFLSQWNDLTTEGHTNQCSVYYKDGTTGYGGHNGSKTFGVSYGYSSGGEYDPRIFFLDDNNEFVINHMYVINSTYAALSMQKGDGFAKAFSYEDQDWFRLNIEGFDKTGTSTGTVRFYLADFTTPSSSGIITEWTKVDLSALGAVHMVKFTMDSSDTGAYGMNTPGYFCFDDIAIEM